MFQGLKLSLARLHWIRETLQAFASVLGFKVTVPALV